MLELDLGLGGALDLIGHPESALFGRPEEKDMHYTGMLLRVAARNKIESWLAWKTLRLQLPAANFDSPALLQKHY